MRAWENRADTCVVDEPLYAHYLETTGIDHPMADAVIASQSSDWQAVTRSLIEEPKTGFRIFYQKHISTHLIEPIELRWCEALCNCILIRDPKRMVASYAKKRSDLNARDLGYAELLLVYEHLLKQGVAPVIIDTDRFLKNPQKQLEKWCDQLEIPFDSAMLNWPAGKRDSDGVWAVHWYDVVEKSTGFAPYKPTVPELDARQQAIADQCTAAYETMLASALA